MRIYIVNTLIAVLATLAVSCSENSGYTEKEVETVREYIKTSWDRTVRQNHEGEGTLIGLPYRYTVPSPHGKFQELYYWDTYFINRGLLIDGFDTLAKENVENILFLVDKYGFMPNGSRTFYLNRSQPPLLSMMVRTLYDSNGDREWLNKAYGTLNTEYSFWMTKRITPCGLNRYSGDMASDEEVRSFVTKGITRLGESYFSEDADSIARYARARHLIAEAESGCDFCPRFDRRCADFCPMDLNSYLYALESNMAYFAEELERPLGEIQEWKDAAEKRRRLMSEFMFDGTCFYDYDYVNGCRSDFLSAAVYAILLCKVATPEQAACIKDQLPKFEHKYGLTPDEHKDYGIDYQWSYPNVWPSTTFIAVFGLDNYGFKKDAKRIAQKYLSDVIGSFKTTGAIWEKYNALDSTVGQSKEYETPEMIGWSAAAFICFDELLKTY